MKNKTVPLGNPFLGPQMNITKKDLETIMCPKCDNNIFDRYFKILRLSALKSQTGKPQYLNMPIYVCANCATILDIDEDKEENKTEPVKSDGEETKEEEKDTSKDSKIVMP